MLPKLAYTGSSPAWRCLIPRPLFTYMIFSEKRLLLYKNLSG